MLAGSVCETGRLRGQPLRGGNIAPPGLQYDGVKELSGDDAEGGSFLCLSFHDSNEWNPSVGHDGRIVWTRWDYVDRHGCIAHMPWTLTLDGRDPRPLHGNYAPRLGRPDMELYVRAIPGSSKYVGLAAPHHGQAYGSIILEMPHNPDFPRRDLINQKMMRCNSIRFIAGVPERYQLDLADEIGLMVYRTLRRGWYSSFVRRADRYAAQRTKADAFGFPARGQVSPVNK